MAGWVQVRKALIRFLARVLILSGSLVLVDAGLTLSWEEPITSFLAARAQSQLKRELRGLVKVTVADERATATVADLRQRLAILGARARRRAGDGQAIGLIQLPTLGRSYAVVQGTAVGDLEKGPGHYPRTPFPGEGGTVAIAGHRTTYLAPFRTINTLRRGAPIVLDMPYGRFVYRVTGVRVVLPTDFSILRPVGHDELVLSACTPLYSASHRVIAFASLATETEHHR